MKGVLSNVWWANRAYGLPSSLARVTADKKPILPSLNLDLDTPRHLQFNAEVVHPDIERA